LLVIGPAGTRFLYYLYYLSTLYLKRRNVFPFSPYFRPFGRPTWPHLHFSPSTSLELTHNPRFILSLSFASRYCGDDPLRRHRAVPKIHAATPHPTACFPTPPLEPPDAATPSTLSGWLVPADGLPEDQIDGCGARPMGAGA
jgi:hypothetical protein